MELDFLVLMDFKLLVSKDALASLAHLFEEDRFSLKASGLKCFTLGGRSSCSRESSRSQESSQNPTSSGPSRSSGKKRRGSSRRAFSDMEIDKRDSASGPMTAEEVLEGGGELLVERQSKSRDRRVSWAKETS